jgi:hypothetical protein
LVLIKNFNFKKCLHFKDKVYSPSQTTKQIYDECLNELLESVLEGYNGKKKINFYFKLILKTKQLHLHMV